MMKVTRRELLKGAAVLGAAGMVPAVGLRDAEAQTTQKRELVTAQGGDVSKFDPHFSTISNEIRVSFNLFDNLTSRRPDGKLYPSLATEWKLHRSDDVAVQIAPGRQVAQRRPLHRRGRQVLDRADLRSQLQDAGRHRFTTVDRIEAPDPYTLWSTPRSPTRSSRPAGRVRRADRAEEVRGAVGPRPSMPSPSGPGRSASCRGPRTTRPVLEAFPTTGAGGSTSTAWLFAADSRDGPRVAALLKGEIDLMTLLPPDHFDRVNENPRRPVTGALSSASTCWPLTPSGRRSTTRSSSRRCPSAIDREAIVKELWRGRGIVPNGPIVKGDNHYDPCLPPLPYDPKEARERLKKAGYRGEPIYIETTVRLHHAMTRRCPRRSPPCGRTWGSTPWWR